MNVTCPNCATVYRVDPAKVPEAGVRARCSICSAVFAIQREGEAQERPAPVTAAAPAAAPPHSAPPPAPARAAPGLMVPPAVPAPMPRPAAAPAMPASPSARPAAALHGPPAPPAASGPPAPGPAAMPAAAPPPPKPAARPPAPGTRPVNPFLSQDPALKARRLARALISDMVVYHPAKRQEGLRDGNLRELFDDEIKKSWEEYAEQVGKDVADTTPYFKEALNEILAGGRQIF